MFDTYLTMTGNICTEPVGRTTKNGEPMATFRLASNVRRLDNGTGQYVDQHTNFVDVVAYRGLARAVLDALQCGDPVIVQGRLKVERWETETSSGTKVEITAQHIGPDLALASCRLDRTPSGAARRSDSVEQQRATRRAESGSPTASLAGLDAQAAATDRYEVVVA